MTTCWSKKCRTFYSLLNTYIKWFKVILWLFFMFVSVVCFSVMETSSWESRDPLSSEGQFYSTHSRNPNSTLALLFPFTPNLMCALETNSTDPAPSKKSRDWPTCGHFHSMNQFIWILFFWLSDSLQWHSLLSKELPVLSHPNRHNG